MGDLVPGERDRASQDPVDKEAQGGRTSSPESAGTGEPPRDSVGESGPGVDRAQSPPQQADGTPTPSRGHRYRRRRHSRSHHRHRSSSRLLLVALSVGAVAGSILIIYLGSRVYALNRDNEQLYRQLNGLQQQLQDLQPKLTELRNQLQMAVQGRVPGLRPLEYDVVLPLQGDRIARNVVFNRTGQEGDWRYEFKLVLENNSLYVVWPRVRLYLFDQRGIQVGLAQLGDLAQLEASQSLGPGEVRSVSGDIEITLSGEPAYFMVESLEPTEKRPGYETLLPGEQFEGG